MDSLLKSLVEIINDYLKPLPFLREIEERKKILIESRFGFIIFNKSVRVIDSYPISDGRRVYTESVGGLLAQIPSYDFCEFCTKKNVDKEYVWHFFQEYCPNCDSCIEKVSKENPICPNCGFNVFSFSQPQIP